MKRLLQYAVLYLLSPLLYALSTRVNGKSWKDFIEFLKGN